jgi:uncharacterized membrane protein YraQ (UPF0718 family)
MKINYFTEASLFLNITTKDPTYLSHLGMVFTVIMAEIGFLHSYCCRTGDVPSVASLAQK